MIETTACSLQAQQCFSQAPQSLLILVLPDHICWDCNFGLLRPFDRLLLLKSSLSLMALDNYDWTGKLFVVLTLYFPFIKISSFLLRTVEMDYALWILVKDISAFKLLEEFFSIFKCVVHTQEHNPRIDIMHVYSAFLMYINILCTILFTGFLFSIKMVNEKPPLRYTQVIFEAISFHLGFVVFMFVFQSILKVW